MKKKIILAIAFLLAMWLGGVINAMIFAPDVGVVLVSNVSSEKIASAQVSICGQAFNFPGIPPGKYAVARYDVTTDSHYDISISFQSGRTLEGEFGYVTHGSDFFDVMEVTDGEIIHAERELPGRE